MRLNHLLPLIMVFISMMLMPPAYAADPAPNPVGRVVWVKGSFKAVAANNQERVLEKAALIYEHDTLVTDDSSTAQIVFTDDTLMTFHPASTFKIDEYSYEANANSKSVGKYVMSLLQGGFRTITGMIAKSDPDDYRVNTPVATIGVRGTDYSVALQAGELAIAYYKGSPCVTAGNATLCLSNRVPFAKVPAGARAVPVPLKAIPAILKQKAVITPAKIESGPTGTKPGSNDQNNKNTGGTDKKTEGKADNKNNPSNDVTISGPGGSDSSTPSGGTGSASGSGSTGNSSQPEVPEGPISNFCITQ